LIKTFAQWTRPVLSLPRPVKRGIVLAVDVALCVLAVWLAYYLRMGDFVTLQGPVLVAVGVSLVLALPIFVVSGLYRAIFRYSNLRALATVVQAVAVYGVLYAFVFTGMAFEGVPRTVGIIQPVLLLLLVGASRAFAGVWFGRAYQSMVKRCALPLVLVYGAGSAGRQLAAAMAHGHEMQVLGFLDDDDRLHGQVLNGLRIYNPKNLAEVLGRLPVTDVLLALPKATRQRRNAILAELAHHHVAVRTLPSVTDLAAGRVGLSDVRELDIDDLLGRDAVKPNGLLINRNTHHKTVLVTGAGGSIGSELCRQILQCQPQQLLLLEMSEFALYQIHQDLQAQLARQADETALAGDAPGIQTELVPLLGSVCDELRMQEIMRTWRPHTLYHAAAYKHVPLVEHNPAEGVRNNVWGTLACAQAAARNGVANFVLVSTDKAVRPTNIMGATKRLAEMVLQALAMASAQRPQQHTTFTMVRFGNVLGSSGSVVPLFREQIKNGGPITLTHPDITRYFMTIPEAAQLVIQAGAMGTGGDVFVLDMGQPVRIADLALRMVELSGLSVRNEANPEGDIALQVTGLRPGEKLYEELLIGDNPQPTQHKRIMKAHEDQLAWDVLQPQLDALQACVLRNDVPGMRALLQTLVPGYTTADAVVDWVSLARTNDPRLETL
jgi:FlaA1/EpsC-like NDP-sugar epimerase